ncbi:hypothetical protein IQ243_07185 [Nostocales cyanobacterium LEGE 11386]|nr:hypothetical protein [Nostocales cyanobacterium LEGE 11386]
MLLPKKQGKIFIIFGMCDRYFQQIPLEENTEIKSSGELAIGGLTS